jgi:hypothetical protein
LLRSKPMTEMALAIGTCVAILIFSIVLRAYDYKRRR